MIKKLIFRIAQSNTFGNVIKKLETTYNSKPDLLRVLTYHRVEDLSDHPALYPGLISSTPRDFANQMDFLANNYNVISIETLLNLLHKQAHLPERSILITFDDAYCSFADHAWPILKRKKLPVTLFIPTAYPNHPERMFWWDRLYIAINTLNKNTSLVTPAGTFLVADKENRGNAFIKLKNYVKDLPHIEAMTLVDQICKQATPIQPFQTVLNWDDLRQLAREGVTLGAHTQTHPLMNRITIQESVNEAVGSLKDLQREIGSVLPVFAYPSGGFTRQVSTALQQNGFSLAFTTIRGLNDMKTIDHLLLKRINVGMNTPFSLLRAQLLQLFLLPNLLPAKA